jgi:hypothetical protein
MKPPRNSLVIMILLGAGLYGALFRFACAGAQQPANDRGATSANPAAGSNSAPELPQFAALRRELVGLRMQIQASEQRLAVAPEESKRQEPELKDPRTDPEARAEYDRTRREYIAGLDAAFRKETMDPTWSSPTAAAVKEAISGDERQHLVVRDVECRSHTCRLELPDDGSGSIGKILPVLAQKVGHDIGGITSGHNDDAGAGPTMVLYMSRVTNR